MSTSIQKAAEELREGLRHCLRDSNDCIASQGSLNLNFTKDLNGTSILKLPENFDESIILFGVFFERISHPQVTSRRYPHDPIEFSNIFMVINKIKSRVKVYKKSLTIICHQYLQYEALFGVMCKVLNNPVYFNNQSERSFILKSMIVTRIEQRRQFPPKPDSVLTHLCEESLDKIFKMIFKNHGMRDREETRDEMEICLKYFNTSFNERYSGQIRDILRSDPKFFETWEPELKKFFSPGVRCAKEEERWVVRLERMFPKFWGALRENKVSNQAISWILYWYVRHTKPSLMSLSESEPFSELMTRLVRPGQMSFPFMDHPKLDFALRWGIVLRSDLMEICLHRNNFKK
jgi:hypothetical protein